MIMTKCSKCENDTSSPANFCSSCGATLSSLSAGQNDDQAQSSTVVGDLNGDGKVDWEDFKTALSRSKKYAADKVNDALTLAQEIMRSAKEKDAAAVEELAKSFENKTQTEKSEVQINRDKFQSALTSTIDVRFAEIMTLKKESEAYLTYIDAQILTARVRGIFKNALNIIPPQIEAACLLSETILTPSAKDKENKIKAAFGIAGGTAGIGIVIGAVGSALGWGAGIIASLATAIVGTSVAGPLGWGIAGLSLAVIAGYFASTSNNQTDTERFMRVLKDSTARAVDAIWAQHGEALSIVVNDVKADS